MNFIPRIEHRLIRVALRLAGVTMGAAAGSMVQLPFALTASTPPVVQTRRALDHLGEAALGWQAHFNCSGCHKQPITLAAMGTAVSRAMMRRFPESWMVSSPERFRGRAVKT